MWRLCSRMSAKRYLLILLLCCSLGSLLAQTSFNSNLAYSYTSGEKSGRALILHSEFYSQTDPYSNLQISNLLDWKDHFEQNSKQKFYDHLRISSSYDDDKLAYGLSYYGSFLGSSEPLYINFDPMASPWVRYRRKSVHQGNIDLGYRLGRFQVLLDNNLRLAVAEPEQVFGDPVEDIDKLLFDSYHQAQLSFELPLGLELQTGFQYKHHHPDTEITGGILDNEAYSADLGLFYEADPNPQSSISLSCLYQHQDWDAMQDYYANQLTTEMRFRYSLLPNLSGFVNIINRSCFAEPGEEIYLISNYARLQLVYTLDYDPEIHSFLMLGTKIRPENKDAFHPDTSAYFAKFNLLTLKDIYLSGSVNYAPEIQSEYTANLSYTIDSISNIFVGYRGRQAHRPTAGIQGYLSTMLLGTELRF